MPTVKLYSEKFRGGGNAGNKLSPTLLSAGAGAGIRAPSINMNAANVNYKGPQPATIQKQALQTSLEAGAAFADSYTKASFEYQKRQDGVIADHAVLEYTNELRDEFYGSRDENGVLSGGYGNLKELDASTGYGGFEEKITGKMMDRLDGLTPQQKQFAAIRMHQKRNTYLTNASVHASSELQKAEAGIKDRQYNTTMEDISTGIMDIGSMQSTLGAYAGDEDERKKRDTQMTKHALYTTLNTQGPAAAVALAKTLQDTPGVGDGVEIYSFLDTLKSDERQDRQDYRAEVGFQRAQKAAREAEAEKAANRMWADNFVPAVNADNGSLGAVVSTMEKAGVAPDALQIKISSGIEEGWDNANLAGPGKTTEYKNKVMRQIDDIPAYLRDDVVRKLADLEDRDVKKIIDAESNRVKVQEQEQAVRDNIIKDRVKDLRVLAQNEGHNSPAVRTELESIYNNPNTTDTQRTELDHFAEGRTPFEAQNLLTIDENWEDIVEGRKQISDFGAIGATKNAELEKRKRLDKKTGAAPYRKSAVTELTGYYKLQKSAIGGFEFLGAGGDVNKDEAKRNYAMAEQYLQSKIDGYLAQDNMSPALAVSQALTDVLANPMLRNGMVGLPKATSSQAKSEEAADTLTYGDDHSQILGSYSIQPIASLEKDGPTNLVEYAAQVGSNWEPNNTKFNNPQAQVAYRAKDMFELFDSMMNEATGTDEQIIISRLISNTNAQYMYLKELVPEAQGARSAVVDTKGYADGDTAGGVRFSGVDAAERKTPLGQQHQAQMRYMLDSMSPSGVFRGNLQGETGWMKRPIGDLTLGETNLSTVGRVVFGFPEYVPYEER